MRVVEDSVTALSCTFGSCMFESCTFGSCMFESCTSRRSCATAQELSNTTNYKFTRTVHPHVMSDTASEQTVELPVWVIKESLFEFDALIERTGGPDGEPSNTPLAEADRRLKTRETDTENDSVSSARSIIANVADERNGGVGHDVDPLTDRTFRARNALATALDQSVESTDG